jgi:hypothetical protein
VSTESGTDGDAAGRGSELLLPVGTVTRWRLAHAMQLGGYLTEPTF